MCLRSLLRMMWHWYSQGEDCFELICQNINCVFTLHLMFSQTCPDREERTTACYIITFLRFWANGDKFEGGASYARGEESKFPSFGFFFFALLPSRGPALPARLALASDRMKNAKKNYVCSAGQEHVSINEIVRGKRDRPKHDINFLNSKLLNCPSSWLFLGLRKESNYVL